MVAVVTTWLAKVGRNLPTGHVDDHNGFNVRNGNPFRKGMTEGEKAMLQDNR